MTIMLLFEVLLDKLQGFKVFLDVLFLRVIICSRTLIQRNIWRRELVLTQFSFFTVHLVQLDSVEIRRAKLWRSQVLCGALINRSNPLLSINEVLLWQIGP